MEQMKFSETMQTSVYIFFILISLLPGCTRRDCDKKPHDYAQLYFQIRDKNTGLPLVAAPVAAINAPDSIRLKDITTNTFYPLQIGAGVYKEALFFVPGYKGKAGTTEVLEFRFGASRPDTLMAIIGTIYGWRGDECRFVNDPGITEVKQNGVTIYRYQQYKDSAFAIKK
jgi:hypothetical protein